MPDTNFPGLLPAYEPYSLGGAHPDVVLNGDNPLQWDEVVDQFQPPAVWNDNSPTPSYAPSTDPVPSQHPERRDSGNGDEEEEDPRSWDKVLYAVLLELPGHCARLQEIYDLVPNETNKWQFRSGWQNSVRHNLSLNKVSDLPQACRASASA